MRNYLKYLKLNKKLKLFIKKGNIMINIAFKCRFFYNVLLFKYFFNDTLQFFPVYGSCKRDDKQW